MIVWVDQQCCFFFKQTLSTCTVNNSLLLLLDFSSTPVLEAYLLTLTVCERTGCSEKTQKESASSKPLLQLWKLVHEDTRYFTKPAVTQLLRLI